MKLTRRSLLAGALAIAPAALAQDKTPQIVPFAFSLYGMRTLGLDERVEAYQQKLSKVLLMKNFVEDSNFKVFRAEGAEPSLAAWRARLSLPLQFLFNPGR